MRKSKMKTQKRNIDVLKKYWKDKIGFDVDKEFLIYQYLCGSIKKRKIKKLNEKNRYQEYRNWKVHVEELISNCEDDVLLELYHFVKLEARRCNIDKGLNNQFAIPLAVTIVASILMQWLFNLDIIGIQVQQDTALRQVSLSILCFFGISFLMGCLGSFLLHFMLEYVDSKNMTAFWEDYLEIIKTKMKTQKIKE